MLKRFAIEKHDGNYLIFDYESNDFLRNQDGRLIQSKRKYALVSKYKSLLNGESSLESGDNVV